MSAIEDDHTPVDEAATAPAPPTPHLDAPLDPDAGPQAHGEVSDIGRLERLVRFLMVGGVGFVVSTTLLALLTGRGVPNFLASLLATEMVIVLNYMLHEVFTFGTRRLTWRRLGAYNLAAGLGLLITAGAFDAISRVTDLPLVVRNLLAVASGTTSNFLLSARFVWGAGPGKPGETVSPTPPG